MCALAVPDCDRLCQTLPVPPCQPASLPACHPSAPALCPPLSVTHASVNSKMQYQYSTVSVSYQHRYQCQSHYQCHRQSCYQCHPLTISPSHHYRYQYGCECQYKTAHSPPLPLRSFCFFWFWSLVLLSYITPGPRLVLALAASLFIGDLSSATASARHSTQPCWSPTPSTMPMSPWLIWQP